MKKIPTLYERIFENHKKVGILPNVTPGMEWVSEGKGIATVKYDGSCCAIINGRFYKRYDAKHGMSTIYIFQMLGAVFTSCIIHAT